MLRSTCDTCRMQVKDLIEELTLEEKSLTGKGAVLLKGQVHPQRFSCRLPCSHSMTVVSDLLWDHLPPKRAARLPEPEELDWAR